MDKNTRYAALNTKVRALEGKLLKDEDFINLLSLKSVPEVAQYLKQNTHYGEILKDIDVREIHRSDLENSLKESYVKNIQKIIHYFYNDYREFYRTLFIRHEIEDLKVMLRNIKTGSENKRHNDSFKYIGRNSSINIDKLLSSNSINEFIRNLKDTIYFKYLRSFLGSRDNVSLFEIEMSLDLAYFDIFYDSLKLIDSEDRKAAEDIQGVNVDLLNIQWIYRGLKFYKLTPEELFNYTIAHGKEFTRKDIKELCYVKSLSILQKKILSTKYSFLFDNETTKNIFMERRILRYQYYYLRKMKSSQALNISSSIIYNLLLEMEIRDIISVIEAIRYEMPVEEAKKFLIRKL